MKTGSEINETLTSLTKNYSGNTLSFKAYAGDGSNIDTSNKLSSDDSKTPCYVWFDSDSSTVYCYAKGYAGSDGKHLSLLNEDSSQMFEECSFTEIDMSGFSAKNVTNMSYMFNACDSLEILGVSSFDTSNVTTMEYMFSICPSLETFDLSNFDTLNVTELIYMFNACDSLTTICTAADADWSSVNSSERMFLGCPNLVGGNETKYDSNKMDATYARIDTSENPGCFTKKLLRSKNALKVAGGTIEDSLFIDDLVKYTDGWESLGGTAVQVGKNPGHHLNKNASSANQETPLQTRQKGRTFHIDSVYELSDLIKKLE